MNIRLKSDKSDPNISVIQKKMIWLRSIIEGRIECFINGTVYKEPAMPDIADIDCYYTEFINKHELDTSERKIFLLALAAEINPEILDLFLIQKSGNRSYTEFGGRVNGDFIGFVPTLKTALFILAGADITEQVKYSSMLSKNSRLYSKRILREESPHNGIENSKILVLSQDAYNNIISGENTPYEYTPEFPASELNTSMEWEDLVLSQHTMEEMDELMAWLEHGDKLVHEYNMGKICQPGYRILFWGPSGTGKTLCATLIGKKAKKPVYRIDLSQMVSKYIGETEKNLEKIFTMAKNRDWILFFDEADALFTKRTGISSSNDRYANQETAYLLQRIETCENLVILATNLNQNIDEAFARRFQSKIYFSIPTVSERLILWENSFSEKMPPAPAIDMEALASKIDIAGGSIVNVVRYCTLMAISEGSTNITAENLYKGLRREYAKYGRTLNFSKAEELKK